MLVYILTFSDNDDITTQATDVGTVLKNAFIADPSVRVDRLPESNYKD